MAAPLLPLDAPLIRHHSKSLREPMKEWLEKKRVPPVLLVTGAAGIGKRSVLHHLAQWLLCEVNGFGKAFVEEELSLGGGLFGETPSAAPATDSATDGPCGQCPSCVRALHGSWVDFTEILPEGDTDTLKIDQFRKLRGSLGFGAHNGPFKITAIPNADRMTVEAANSLLKVLEEPPPGWLFFLTASDPTLVLPTILSRCQTLRLRPLDKITIREILSLRGTDSRRRDIAAELSQGSLGRALSLSNDDVWEHRKALFDFLGAPETNLNALLDWATQESGEVSHSRSHFDLLLDQLESILWDLIRWSVSSSTEDPAQYPWANSDGRQALATHARKLLQQTGSPAGARAFWDASMARLAQARQRALAPLNRKILVQDVLLPWLDPR